MNKTRVYKLLEKGLWIINPLLFFLLIFYQQLKVGIWGQWLGGFHPMLLHFPIVTGIAAAVYFLAFSNNRFSPATEKLMLSANALLCGVTALLGILLAKSGSYQGEVFLMHKWGGAFISLVSWILFYLPDAKVWLKRSVAFIFLGVMITATHKGAQLTHGVDALAFPDISNDDSFENVLAEGNTTVYSAGIAPLFQKKCVGCHGADKSEGNLRLDSPDQISKGGKNGDVFSRQEFGEPLILALLHLPEEHDRHMPPEGKQQLTIEELSILREWIDREKRFELRIKDLPTDDKLMAMLSAIIEAEKKKELKSDLPDLEKFNTDYCNVTSLYNGSSQVKVSFFQGSFYQHETLKNLLDIKDNVVQLNLQQMPLSQRDLNLILQFKNLTKLNINSTPLSYDDVSELKALNHLEKVSICGIELEAFELEDLLSESNWKEINLWTEKLEKEQVDAVRKKFPGVEITLAESLADEVLKINPPSIVQESNFIRDHLYVSLEHMLSGVDIYYTSDGSIPDSSGTKYSAPVKLENNTVLKARAFKTGWLGSDVTDRNFYRAGIRPDSLYLLVAPHSKYKAKGAATLTDLSLGEDNSSNGEWLGYTEDMIFVAEFKKETLLKSVGINSLIDLPTYIFPVKAIQVEGSNDNQNYERLAERSFPDASREEERRAALINCEIPVEQGFKYYRFTISNLKDLPEWHPGHGNPAWIFIDEVFLN